MPLSLATLLAANYIGLAAIGILMPDYSKIDYRGVKTRAVGNAQMYDNPNYGFQLLVPPEWKIEEKDEERLVTVSKAEGACNAMFMAEGVLPIISTEKYLSLIDGHLKENKVPFTSSGRKQTSLGRYAGLENDYIADYDGSNVHQRYIVAKDGLTMFIMVASFAEGYEEYCSADFEAMRTQVRFD